MKKLILMMAAVTLFAFVAPAETPAPAKKKAEKVEVVCPEAKTCQNVVDKACKGTQKVRKVNGKTPAVKACANYKKTAPKTTNKKK